MPVQLLEGAAFPGRKDPCLRVVLECWNLLFNVHVGFGWE